MRSVRRLAILESDWFPGYNHSVKPFFEGLSRNLYSTADGFYYERFVGQASLEDSLIHLARRPDVRHLYLASHGRNTYIRCPNGDKVRRVTFDTVLTKVLERRRLDGVYFASCLFGTKKTGELLVAAGRAEGQQLKWVAGYTEAIDWMESMALDWLFWNQMLTREQEQKEGPVARIKAVVGYLAEIAPELVRTCKFHVYVRRRALQGETPQVVDIMAAALASARRRQPANPPPAK